MGGFAIGYVRVSTQDQADEGMSLEAQRAKVKAYAELQDLELLGIEEDAGLSGKRADNRPGLQRALKLACKRKAVVVVYSLSRLARSTRDAIDISSRLERAGANLASISEKLDTTSSMGRFFFTLMAALAQLERDQISERTTATLGHMRRQRLRISGNLPYGYALAGDGRGLVELPDELEVVRKITDARTRGESLGAIAKDLNARGIKSKTGKAWQRCSIGSILKRVKVAAIAAAVLLCVSLGAGGCASRSSTGKFDRSMNLAAGGIAGVVAHTESAERHVQSAIPYTDTAGRQWLTAASEEHRETLADAGDISDALTLSQDEFKRVAGELATLEGKWFVRWGRRIERALWVIGITWLVLGVASIVAGMGNPLSLVGWIGRELVDLLPFANPFKWVRRRLERKRKSK